jgi:hypothetical protein
MPSLPQVDADIDLSQLEYQVNFPPDQWVLFQIPTTVPTVHASADKICKILPSHRNPQ